MACLDTRDKVYSSEDFGCHRYILSFETLRLIWSHQQLEPILTANCWEPVSVCKFKGWREYHYYKPKMSSSEESVILRKVRLPEPIEDAPKKDILKLVRRVNEMAKKNILCAWIHRGPRIAPLLKPGTTPHKKMRSKPKPGSGKSMTHNSSDVEDSYGEWLSVSVHSYFGIGKHSRIC
ncbi:hypothetical protein MPTK1_2g22800 [Marchantia polymorpha subsp. ruderalis]|uniref:Uncharacterized protein n=1 Tax=Marchantia polymorpha TaxID=3197 RepID=A0A2R6WN76_MARPO|nr:hypothetical protein MARPO_0072s0052 [Marchantia polymorpha]BBN03344.1 hypothetical protein Mp_2g22800 [Marchantia polymorpha subsp. ruderalis]|eukprot:PTQ35308.1 hypothetical protein MARPO_0072s0052 [Marchantia polymorpha]